MRRPHVWLMVRITRLVVFVTCRFRAARTVQSGRYLLAETTVGFSTMNVPRLSFLTEVNIA